MITGIKPRQSKVLKKLRAGEVVSCTKLNTADSRIFEIAAMSGFDCLWTDMEHMANDWSVVERQILASKAYGCDILVRVARGGYSDYTRALELDASGIMVPHIMNAADAEKIVRMTRFHPIGRRPLDGGCADGAYCNIDVGEYIKGSNTEKFIIVQIEDPEPLQEIEKIASIEGLDMLFFGAADFSQGIGDPGNFENPKLLEALRIVAEAALKAGKYAGTVGSPESLGKLIEMGYHFISMGADVVALSEYYPGLLKNYELYKGVGNECSE